MHIDHSYRLSARGAMGALVFAVVAAASMSPPAAADTIYLKNGRTIDTASATVTDDRVMFMQFGHPVSIPMSQVDRIEENDAVGPAATPTTAPVPRPTTVNPAPSAAGTRADPEQSKDYWQNRVRAINAEAEGLELEMQRLRRVERAFLFSHRSTADTRRQIEDVQARIDANEQALPTLRREARAKGIPAGWLRLPRGG
jgi:hypothetical protein